MNNKIKNNNNKDKEKKELNKKLEIIHNVNIFYEKNKKINLTNNSNKESINNNKALKVFNEINFELIKTLKKQQDIEQYRFLLEEVNTFHLHLKKYLI